MKTPLFSVVIDNYNYGRYIGQAIESVLAQDFPASDFELIVVDDGSTDNSVEVVSRYKDKLTLLQQPNQKQVAAFRSGFSVARGEIVCLLDSDDYWTADKLKVVAAAFAGDDVAAVQHYLRDVDISGKPLNNPLENWPAAYTLEDFVDGRCSNMATSGVAFRRSLLDQIVPTRLDVRWIDEYMTAHSLFFGRLVNIRQILGYHRVHGNNWWAQRNHHPEALAAHIREFYAFRAYFEPKLRERGKDFTPRYRTLIGMEISRYEMLLAMHQGRRGEAFSRWLKLIKQYSGTALGFFRSATCALMLISPAVYLNFYEWYGGRGNWPARVRRFFLPDPN